MNTLLTETLGKLRLGPAQQAGNLTVFPLLATPNGGPEYLTLAAALEPGTVSITEVSEGGSVPDLLAVNKGETAVLALDGEELRGAKQNRVLNTTILMAAHSEMVIPVSCTEQGRWAYASEKFHDSKVVMTPKLRGSKLRSVRRSMETGRGYRADQGEVWNNVRAQNVSGDVHSPTGAMRDSYQSKASELDEYVQATERQPEQCGLLAFVNGKVAGCDLVSRPEAYAELHTKLTKSYALDALLERKNREAQPVSTEKAEAFLEDAQQCSVKQFDSVGLGADVHLESANVTGSALVVEQTVIHMALFAGTMSEQADRMAGYRRRRGFRGEST